MTIESPLGDKLRGISVQCCNCEGVFELPTINNINEGEGCTLNCGHCGDLLIVVGGVIKDFHRHINIDNPSWPSDGRGTDFVGLNLEEKE